MDYDVEELVKKVGGKFRLVTLMQKRMRQLRNEMSKKDKDINPNKLKQMVAEEIMAEKIFLDVDDEIVFNE